jgi:hypothetical protein
MKYIKHIAIAALFIIGAIEILTPFGIAMMFYALSPETRRVFATAEQHQLYQQLHASVYAKGQTVFYLGIATIVIGIILLVADRKKKPDA